jgi:hypothetical protein
MNRRCNNGYGGETEHRYGDSKDDLLKRVLFETYEKLRSDFIPDGEKKQKEHETLERSRGWNVELAHEHACKQRRRHVVEVKLCDLEIALG